LTSKPPAAMDFFSHQDTARRKTGLLVALMSLAVISMIAITVAAVVLTLAFFDGTLPQGVPLSQRLAYAWSMMDARMAASIALGVGGLVLLGSLYKRFQLRAGGRAVAESLGARKLVPDSPALTDEEQQLLNIVREMALAASMPTPDVYLMDDDAINAFAAGRNPEDAVIGVTRGCIMRLDREALQGVIAHEFSHIVHGDMRMNLRLVAALHGILLIGLAGYYLLRVAPLRRRTSSKDNSALVMMVIALVLIVIGFAGTFFGNLIKAAISRQREYLADASAVQYTRNPNGITKALKSIGAHASGSRLTATHAPDFSHMFFGEAVGGAFMSLLATHPPIEARIKRLEPGWDGTFPSQS